MSAIRYLYKTSGEYAAFILGDNVFTPDAEWIGVVVNGNEIYSPDGLFLGYLLDDDRIVRRRNETKPRRMRSVRPMRPMRPMRPLRRLRMARLPHPYEDVLEKSAGGKAPPAFSLAPKMQHLEGASIVAADGTTLGRISRDRYAQDSIANTYGPFGGQYSPTSIFNKYGQYGGQYSQYSPFNPYSTTPPRVIRNNQVLGYLTVNKYIAGNRIDPEELSVWLSAA